MGYKSHLLNYSWLKDYARHFYKFIENVQQSTPSNTGWVHIVWEKEYVPRRHRLGPDPSPLLTSSSIMSTSLCLGIKIN